jgi:hypothetical protein
MRTAINIVLILVVAVGVLWTLQGANVLGGTAMSGHPEWLYGGLAVTVVGLIGLWWFNRRRAIAR